MKVQLSTGKLIAILTLALVVTTSIGLGFIAGFYNGTGVLPTYRSEIIVPPSELTTATATETEQTLISLQDKEYGDGYNCVDYAWEAMRLLRWQGQASVMVGLDIDADPEYDHVVLLVPTEDKGWIFIEPQSGKQVTICCVGSKYVGQEIKAIDIMTIGWIPFEDYIDMASNVTEASNG